MQVVMCWSGGKDSAVALWRLQQDRRYELTGLLTTLTEGYQRVSMHGVREELLRAQADVLNLPLYHVWIPPGCVNPVYEARMGEAVARLKADGVETVAYGDLFLEDIRAYREKMMAPTGLQTLFPLWNSDTRELSRWVLANGFRATLSCVDPAKVPASFAGREYDEDLLAELPAGVDPCAEYGEFHTFVWNAYGTRRTSLSRSISGGAK